MPAGSEKRKKKEEWDEIHTSLAGTLKKMFIKLDFTFLKFGHEATGTGSSLLSPGSNVYAVI